MKHLRTIVLGFLGGLLGSGLSNALFESRSASAQDQPPNATFSNLTADKLTVNSVIVKGGGLEVVNPPSTSGISLSFVSGTPTIGLNPGQSGDLAIITPTYITFNHNDPKASPPREGFASYSNAGIDLYDIGALGEVVAKAVGDAGRPQLFVRILNSTTKANLTAQALDFTK